MPNDVFTAEFNKIVEEAEGCWRVVEAYNILLKYKGMSMPEIKNGLMAEINSNEISVGVRSVLAWAFVNVNAGLSSEDYDLSVDGMYEIIQKGKIEIESELASLLTRMLHCGNPSYAAFAQSFMDKVGEKSLYDQVMEDILRKTSEQRTDDSMPGR